MRIPVVEEGNPAAKHRNSAQAIRTVDHGDPLPLPPPSSSKPKKDGAVAAAIQRFEMATLLHPPPSPPVNNVKKGNGKTFVTPPGSPQKMPPVGHSTGGGGGGGGGVTTTPQKSSQEEDTSMSPASSQVHSSTESSSSPESSHGTSHEAAATIRSMDETIETRSVFTRRSTESSIRSRSYRTSRRMALDGVPKHVIPLPPPPSDCGSANMSTGSVTLTVFSQDSFVQGEANSWVPPTTRAEQREQQRQEQQQQPPPSSPPQPTTAPPLTSDIPPSTPDPAPQASSTQFSSTLPQPKEMNMDVDVDVEEEEEEVVEEHFSVGPSKTEQAPPTLPPLSPISMSHHTKFTTKSCLRSSVYSCNGSSTGIATDSTGSSSPGHPYSQKKKKASFSPLPPQQCVIPDDRPESAKKTKRKKPTGHKSHTKKGGKRRTNVEKKKCQRTVMWYLIGVALCLVVVAVGVNLLLYFDVGKSDSSPSALGNETSAPMVPDDDAVVENFNDETGSGTVPTAPSVDDPSGMTIVEGITEILTARFRISVPEGGIGSNPSPIRQAVYWLAAEASSSGQDPATVLDDYNTNVVSFAQRFAMLVLLYSLVGSENYPSNLTAGIADFMKYPIANVDICQWVGVTCDAPSGRVISIDFSDIGLKGTIPPEIRLLAGLKVLDLSHNEIQGSIPPQLFDLRQLEKIYLYRNQLEGSISSSISQLDLLEVLQVSHNNLSGPIPQQLQSPEGQVRPLRFVDLHANSLSGTIPSNLRLSEVTYFDLGRNRIGGTIPTDIGSDFTALRHLFLDNNRLTGSIPSTIPTVGNGRLEVLEVDHNALTGTVPDNYSTFNKLVQVRFDSNNFESLGPQNCMLSLFQNFGGELIEFKADCDVCSCNDRFCERMCDLQFSENV